MQKNAFSLLLLLLTTSRERKSGLCFSLNQKKKIAVFFPANAAIEIEPNPERITSKFNVNGTSFGARSLVLLIFRNDIAIE